jgi:hypothetical protein
MAKFYFSILFFISLNVFSQNDKIHHIKNTGVNMTVAILTVDSFVSVGDTIVSLYKLDDLNYQEITPFANPNSFAIGGITIWEGERLAVALWGNDTTSDKKDGFLNHEFITWAILKDNKYIPIQMIYRVGRNVWEANGISIVDSLKLGC